MRARCKLASAEQATRGTQRLPLPAHASVRAPPIPWRSVLNQKPLRVSQPPPTCERKHIVSNACAGSPGPHASASAGKCACARIRDDFEQDWLLSVLVSLALDLVGWEALKTLLSRETDLTQPTTMLAWSVSGG